MQQPQLQPYSPPSGQIQPGQITYTTTSTPDGRITYHPFKFVVNDFCFREHSANRPCMDRSELCLPGMCCSDSSIDSHFNPAVSCFIHCVLVIKPRTGSSAVSNGSLRKQPVYCLPELSQPVPYIMPTSLLLHS